MLERTPFVSDRLKALEAIYPPENPAHFLAMQRRWVRRVNADLSLTHAERCAAVFIGMFCSPSRPFCAAGTDYIGKHVGCDRTVIFRATKKLEDAGLLDVDRGKRRGNVYRLKWDFCV